MNRVFKRLTVDVHFNPVVHQRVLVEWALEPSFVEIGPYTFTLYRSNSPTSDNWVPVAATVDQPWAYDHNPQLPTKGLNVFYKVVLEDGDGQKYESQAVNAKSYWDRYDWSLAREIIRKESMLMQKRAGVKGWLFKRRTMGDPCPCVDQDTEEILDPNCEDCWGTAFKQGYYAPFEYWVLMNPTQSIKKLDAEVGLLTENIETVRALAYPVPQPNDFWVHAHTDQRYRIESDIAALARHRGIDLVLQLRMSEVDRNDPIYKVPTPCE